MVAVWHVVAMILVAVALASAQPFPGGPYCKKGPCNGPVVVFFSSDNCDASHGATATQQVYTNDWAALSGQCVNRTVGGDVEWSQWTCGKDPETGLEAILTKHFHSDAKCASTAIKVSKTYTRQCVNLSHLSIKQSAMYLCSQKDQIPFPAASRVAVPLPVLNGASLGFCPTPASCENIARITYYKDTKCQTPIYSTSLMPLNTTAGAPARYDQCYLDVNRFLNQEFTCSSDSWSNSQYMSGCSGTPILTTSYSTKECFALDKGYYGKYQC